MTYPEEQSAEAEKDAAEFEKLLEQVYRQSTAQKKTVHPEKDAKKEDA